MNKRVIVRQNGYKDCAGACLLSIMRYYGFDASLDEISYILKTNKDGTNAYNLINGSRNFGFDGYGIHYTYEEIISSSISFPIICHVIKNGMYHFIVVYKVKKDKLIVMDPSTSKQKLDKETFKEMYQGSSIVIYPVKRFNKIENRRNLINIIKDYLYEEKTSLIRISILSIITILLGIVLNYYLLVCIDIILPNYKYSFLLKISSLFLLLNINKNILDMIKDKEIAYLDKSLSIKLTKEITTKLFNLPYQFFKNKSTPEVITRIQDMDEFKNILINLIITSVSNLLLVFSSVLVLLLINKTLFLINLSGIIIYLLIILINKEKINEKSEEVLYRNEEYNKSLTESIYGYESLKNLNLINETIKKENIKCIKKSNAHYNYRHFLLNIMFIKNIIINTSYILSIFISITYIQKGIISLGEFTLFNSILYYFEEPIENIINAIPNINYLKIIYNRITSLLLMKEEKQINENILKGDIKINNLSYSYNGLKKVIDKLNLEFKYGNNYLIYGTSGNGKSTIMKILLKYLNDYEGEIYLKDQNLKDISSLSLNKSITYVSQNSFIFNDTLKNNIVMDRNISEEEYEKVIDICGLTKLRDKNKLRNNYIIEDNGFNISGGERQKIILARSILKKSNYIILDEALSEVDFEEEKEIINKLIEYFKEKTIIYISHKEEIISLFNLKYKIERSKTC